MAAPGRRTRAWILLGLTGAAALALLLTGIEPSAVHAPAPAAPTPLPEERVLSLLAVGDTGEMLPWRPFGEGQRSVARGLVAEDRRAPVEALVLLGDNFYPDGLQAYELVARVRRNLVGPFCRFVSAGAPRWREVEDACPIPRAQRHAVPILAVLGNHDYDTEESPDLQRDVVPKLVSNWNVHRDMVEVTELGRGVSLVRVDWQRVQEAGTAEPVREALSHSRGLWRILVTHEPLAKREGTSPRPGSTRSMLRRAIAESANPAQLVLSGHDHNLQVITLEMEPPALQVIAGGGSSRRALKQPPYAGRAFAAPSTGFARVDLMGYGIDQGLRVSLYSMPRYPIHFWRDPRLVSQWWIARDGTASRIYPPKS